MFFDAIISKDFKTTYVTSCDSNSDAKPKERHIELGGG